MQNSKTHKAVLITGAARRLGRTIAEVLAEAGYDVALHYRHSQQEAQELQQRISAKGQQCILLQQDLCDLQALQTLVLDAKEGLPHLCALVNNASTFRRIPFHQTTPASYAEDMRINAEVPFFLIHAYAEQIGCGAVVNMLDAHIHQNQSAYCAYSLAKKQLAAFTEMAALDLAPHIRVNAVCPGFILPSEGKTVKDPAKESLPPSGKRPTPQQVSSAVLMALEEDYLYGQMLYVDGGQRLGT